MKKANYTDSVFAPWHARSEREWFLDQSTLIHGVDEELEEGGEGAVSQLMNMDDGRVDNARYATRTETTATAAARHGVDGKLSESWIDLDNRIPRKLYHSMNFVDVIHEDDDAGEMSETVQSSDGEDLDEDDDEDDDDYNNDGEEIGGLVKRARFNNNTTRTNKNKKKKKNNNTSVASPYDLNTSLTTILAARRSAYNSGDEDNKDNNDEAILSPDVHVEDSQVVFMDISNTSSVVSSTQLSMRRNKKRRVKRSDGSSGGSSSSSSSSPDLAQGIVFISIIASLSFSAGYAFAHSRRNLY